MLRGLKAILAAALLVLLPLPAVPQCVVPANSYVVKTTSYTLQANDTGKVIIANCASACTMTLPATPQSPNWMVWIQPIGAGQVTVAPNGATMNGSSSNVALDTVINRIYQIGTDNSVYYLSLFPVDASKVCAPGTFASQTDGATVTWDIGSKMCANASLTFTTHGGSRTLNLTGLVSGGSYVLKIIQDGTGGEGLTLGTGCTWKVSGGGSGAITPSTSANAIDVLAFTYDGTSCLANFNKNFN